MEMFPLVDPSIPAFTKESKETLCGQNLLLWHCLEHGFLPAVLGQWLSAHFSLLSGNPGTVMDITGPWLFSLLFCLAEAEVHGSGWGEKGCLKGNPQTGFRAHVYLNK